MSRIQLGVLATKYIHLFCPSDRTACAQIQWRSRLLRVSTGQTASAHPQPCQAGALTLRFRAPLCVCEKQEVHYRMPFKHVNQAVRDLPRLCLKPTRTRRPQRFSKAVHQSDERTPHIKVLQVLRTGSASVPKIKNTAQIAR